MRHDWIKHNLPDLMIKINSFDDLKASLGSKRVLFSYFIITEPTELKLS